MVNKITIRSTSTEDVKIAQKALETIGFITVKEYDTVESYNVEMSVPDKYYFELSNEEGIKLSKNKY